jgi:hypothetical protein
VPKSIEYSGFTNRLRSPGRFFAANQLKLLLAQIMLNYEIESIPERPQNPWINNTVGPPIWSKVRIRRRPDPSNPPFSPESTEISKPTFLLGMETRRPSTFLDARVLQSFASSAHELASPMKVD